jgi:glycerophosphoryl diester phosphodiesterase
LPDSQVGKPLFRKLKDGRILKWDVRSEDALCTLREVFRGVHRRVGFNVELKFDDDLVYTEDRLTCILQAVLKARAKAKASWHLLVRLPSVTFLKRMPTDALLLGVQVVSEHAGNRPIIFSSFQPDAAQLIRKLQDKYPVSVTTTATTMSA